MPPPPQPINLVQISGWIKVHSIFPELRAHNPTNINSKDFVLSIEDALLQRLNPELQIASRIWIKGTIVRSESKFIHVRVQDLSYSAPLN
ncbi:uncharacterized protein PGTG_20719 [Puccinia graminis f. sp. tritici CRL 75-36-700-3]|uniref:Uncharacterized protein n=1 Tax=Puccinia graminis f. sp. tritici (strain CRL 75-36-700-3 / race SCCL) TaxID=418459 RepID=H6QP20_PUCGT|nr:uncharacterized protein PGTG_20719 [Puccinia graminis f. sp. tritici CRL 75-36-700-3]EHS63134.1 hypothetical protein PGTG_20719 [Puccinia graminis f. sp. tritici CRL 75-36-700-3]